MSVEDRVRIHVLQVTSLAILHRFMGQIPPDLNHVHGRAMIGALIPFVSSSTEFWLEAFMGWDFHYSGIHLTGRRSLMTPHYLSWIATGLFGVLTNSTLATGQTSAVEQVTSPIQFILSPTPLSTPQPASDTAVSTETGLPVRAYSSFPRLIPVPSPGCADRNFFTVGRKGTTVTITGNDGRTFSGMVTSNSEFLRSVLKPALLPHRDLISAMHPVDRINALTLFGHEAFRTWFGKDAFAWGGHIHDLDDPQESGPNYENVFGLDCSGFAALPFELAVEIGVMDANDSAAIWTARGFEREARANGIRDRGGRDGSSNRWRVDTADMTSLGRVIFSVPKNGVPQDTDLKLLQAGDLVLMQGHVGITVMIQGAPHYLEHGGWVCPPNGALPVPMAQALTVFARYGQLTIRRSLPDRVPTVLTRSPSP